MTKLTLETTVNQGHWSARLVRSEDGLDIGLWVGGSYVAHFRGLESARDFARLMEKLDKAGKELTEKYKRLSK